MFEEKRKTTDARYVQLFNVLLIITIFCCETNVGGAGRWCASYEQINYSQDDTT